MSGWGSGSWGSGSWGSGGSSGQNLGFEDAGISSGIPDKWTLVSVVTGLLYLEFDEGNTFEPFNWGATFIESLLFNSVMFLDGDLVETFDSWVSSGLIITPPLSAITFLDFLNVETFETLWSGNEFYKTDFVGLGTDLTAISFVGPSSVEDWEDGWGNDTYKTDFVGVGTDLTQITFDGTAAWAGPVEDWEEVKEDDIIFVTPTSNVIQTTLVHGLAINDIVFFRNENGFLPGGLLAEPTPWYVWSAVGNLLEVASVPSAPAEQDITDFGNGTNYLRYDPAIYWREKI